jgi:D-glycero-alpha-D-manno-heptose 1-phosphate guanylyltransferase
LFRASAGLTGAALFGQFSHIFSTRNSIMTDAIILAGGFGTRLREAVPNLPKPLAPINGVAFLDLLLTQIEHSGVIKKVIIAIGYRAEAIRNHLSRRTMRVPIEFSMEDQPLGTGGAVKKAMNLVQSPEVFVFNGDSYLECALGKMLSLYRSPVTLAYTHVPEASRFGQLEIDSQGRILAFREKEMAGRPGFINGGIYLFDRNVFDRPMPAVFSLEKKLFPELLEEGMFGFLADGIFIDIGTPESYLKAQTLLYRT